jgi:uncharacterized protein YuzE
MEAVKILEKESSLSWDYDEDADVLYVSVGEPRPAEGVDIGEGVILRYDEVHREVVGMTVIGVRARLMKSLESAGDPHQASPELLHVSDAKRKGGAA